MGMKRYPNYITFAWQRCGDDCDYEVVGTLNGETVDEDAIWNYLVRQTLAALRLEGRDVQAYHREDVYSVLEHDGTDWEPIKVGVSA
jgi:hypothetical protein